MVRSLQMLLRSLNRHGTISSKVTKERNTVAATTHRGLIYYHRGTSKCRQGEASYECLLHTVPVTLTGSRILDPRGDVIPRRLGGQTIFMTVGSGSLFVYLLHKKLSFRCKSAGFTYGRCGPMQIKHMSVTDCTSLAHVARS